MASVTAYLTVGTPNPNEHSNEHPYRNHPS